jgi:hypothetical protein
VVIAEGVDLGRELGESLGVISPGSADELNLVAVFVGDQAPAVVFLFVHPALAVKGAANFIPLHQSDLRKAHQ